MGESAKVGCVNGLETGSSLECAFPGGTFSIQNSIARNSGYACRTNPTTTGIGYIGACAVNGTTAKQNIPLGFTDTYSRFYYYVATAPGSGAEEFMSAFSNSLGQNQMSLRLTSARKIASYDSTDSLIATGATVLSTATWYCIEVYFHSSASGAYTVKINQVAELSGTGNFTTSASDTIYFGKATDRSGQSVDFYFDDIIIGNQGFFGAGRVICLVPSANGTYQHYTIGAGSGSHYQIVGIIPPPGDTSYLVGPNVNVGINSYETELIPTRAAAGITVSSVNAIKEHIYVKRNSTTNGAQSPVVISNGTNGTTGNCATTSAYGMGFLTLSEDPATGVAWLPAGLDTLEVGVQNGSTTSATASRLSSMAIHVDFAPSATFTPALTNFNLGNGF